MYAFPLYTNTFQLKLYIQYVNNYNQSIDVVTNKLKEPQFTAFMDSTLANPDVVKMGLKGLQNFQILPGMHE